MNKPKRYEYWWPNRVWEATAVDEKGRNLWSSHEPTVDDRLRRATTRLESEREQNDP